MENNKLTKIFANYKRNNRWLGIIDYKSLAVIAVYSIIIFNIVNVFNINIKIKIYICIFAIVPIFSAMCANKNSDSAIDVIIIVSKYIFSKKIYVNNYKSLMINNVSFKKNYFNQLDKKMYKKK